MIAGTLFDRSGRRRARHSIASVPLWAAGLCCGLLVAGTAPLPTAQVESASALDEGTAASSIPPLLDAPCDRCNVVVVLIDTLRADHLGAYGYHRETSPHIDALARESLVFRNAIAQSTWTKPATASLLTGLYPKNHGANTLRQRLADDRVLLSEYLQRAGYRTYGIVANGNAGPLFNFDRGYDRYEYIAGGRERPDAITRSDRVNEKVLPIVPELSDAQPFLLFIHYVDPHEPYLPGARRFSRAADVEFDRSFFKQEGYRSHLGDAQHRRELRSRLVDSYDDEIRYNDASFGRVLGALEGHGLLERSVVVVVSDHGEELLERGGLGHKKPPYEEQVRVPLIVRVPGVGHRQVHGRVEQVDVTPSLLSLVGVAVPPGLDGEDLFRSPWQGEVSYAELDDEALQCTAMWRRDEKLASCVDRGETGGTTARYHALADDPAERRNLYADEAVAGRVRALESELERYRADRRGDRTPAARVELDEAQKEAMRALGYEP